MGFQHDNALRLHLLSASRVPSMRSSGKRSAAPWSSDEDLESEDAPPARPPKVSKKPKAKPDPNLPGQRASRHVLEGQGTSDDDDDMCLGCLLTVLVVTHIRAESR